jgi:divalent metal cation (Fe/Co/Zn/Cd) transporter
MMNPPNEPSALSGNVRIAFGLALVTMGYNVLEGLVSLGFGIAGESVALLGFGADSWIEFGSATVVLWRLRGEAGAGTRLAGTRLAGTREKKATLIIGSLLTGLGISVIVGATLRLLQGAVPDTTLPGIAIGAVSLSFMGFLWRAKLRVAHALDSRTLLLDAACSRSCLQLSAILFLGSLLFMIFPELWWADASAAILLALLITREGVEGIRAARRPDFAGGCPCGHASRESPGDGDACASHLHDGGPGGS